MYPSASFYRYLWNNTRFTDGSVQVSVECSLTFVSQVEPLFLASISAHPLQMKAHSLRKYA